MDKAPVLICYDGSENANDAIDVAARLLGDRRAVVVDIGSEITAAESLATLSPVVPGSAFEDLNTADARQRAQAGAERANRAGFEAEARAELASPLWEGVVDIADEIDASVIVIGSRGLNGFQEAFRGSFSHQVAEHAGRPVLIVPPRHAQR